MTDNKLCWVALKIPQFLWCKSWIVLNWPSHLLHTMSSVCSLQCASRFIIRLRVEQHFSDFFAGNPIHPAARLYSRDTASSLVTFSIDAGVLIWCDIQFGVLLVRKMLFDFQIYLWIERRLKLYHRGLPCSSWFQHAVAAISCRCRW
jgi:hypothetical protein